MALAYNGFELARRAGRLTEPLEVCQRMRQVSEGRPGPMGFRGLARQPGANPEGMGAAGRGAPQTEEVICLELGNKDRLAYCFWQWGLLERARGNCQGEHTRLSAAQALFTELTMPREGDAVPAELARAQVDAKSGVAGEYPHF